MQKNQNGNSSRKKTKIIAMTVIVCAAAAFILLLAGILLGYFNYMGPFRQLSVYPIVNRYKNNDAGETVFYGPSNFRLWRDMEEDLAPYAVQNHGIGGATDDDLIKYANKLLYPYEPSIAFFQTGSNDIAQGMKKEEIVENKRRMYQTFRTELDSTVFVVMSGLPLPGRAQYWDATREINDFLRQYCAQQENMIFIDCTDIMLDAGGGFNSNLFKKDGIHLNRAGQLLWAQEILAVLETLQAAKRI